MDKFEKFLRSEMSARRLCELAEGEGLGLVPILQRTPRQPTERPFGRQAAAPFRAVSVCVAHGPRRGVCASRSQPARSFPYGLQLPFCFLFCGLFCSAFGFCCALTGSLSFGVRARYPLKTTPTGLPHSLALPSRCRCGEGSIRGEGTVSCSRGNCRGTGSDTNRTGSRSKLRC
jgi:hypothetical protein